MIKPEQQAVEFLFFSYFKMNLKQSENFEKVLKRSVELAYNDAVMQNAFNALIEKNNEELRKKAEEAHKEAEGELISRVEELLNSSASTYDERHSVLCNTIVDFYKDGGVPLFIYGNAQKWVNMTMKYIYIAASLRKFCGMKDHWSENVIEKSIYFHVPVDSYIIKKIWSDLQYKDRMVSRNKSDNGEEIIEVKWGDADVKIPVVKANKSNLGAYSGEKVKGWSKWCFEDYIAFWDSVKDSSVLNGKTPIDWETEAWIKQAEEERKKN